jgi:hypothetical protein
VVPPKTPDAPVNAMTIVGFLRRFNFAADNDLDGGTKRQCHSNGMPDALLHKES